MKILTVLLLAIVSPAISLWYPTFKPPFTNYCAEELCDGALHIACNNTGEFSPKCPANARIIPFTPEMKRLSLYLHNKYRNEIALGLVNGYEKACGMATLVWNEQLAELAEMNAKTCVFAHDACRNTDQFLYAGQNIGQIVGKRRHLEPEFVIVKVIEGWFKEHLDADMSYINSCHHAPGGIKIGHFTQLVRDEEFAMGCAMSQFEQDNKYTTIFACDYTLSNIDDYPIYKPSTETASCCKTSINKDFPGLCSVDEIYDNELFYQPWD